MRRLAAAAVLGGFLIGSSACGEVICGERKALVTALDEFHSEFPEGNGLMPGGSLIELFVSKSGSFTVLVTAPTGLSCVAAVGTDWWRKEDQPSATDHPTHE